MNRQEPNDVSDLANSAAKISSSSSVDVQPIGDAIQTRAVQIAVLLRQRGASVQAGQPQLLDWASQGVTDAQLLTALEAAQAQRHERADPSPINAGFLNAIVQSQRRKQQAQPAGGRFKSRTQQREETAQLMFAKTRQHGGFDGKTIDHE
ncbi:MAG TPA: hypothetical protein VFX23_11005 [Limnobacter sp.]|uniref:hypothetical protein n=1 Tax=Limnobacter sp. TaxID=2003368 RepID=UPI002E302CD8|nr:hypothetical protein [Limnobacter sp.]HEX5486513.1 hypothetical protein [Limnobacter sp.]